jgi:hypothetical protein
MYASGNSRPPVPIPDTTKPVITITSPSPVEYIEGTLVLAKYFASDASNIKSCVGTVPVGSPIDTTGIGIKSFTVTAIDAAGNTSTKTISYTVKKDSSTPPVPITVPQDVKDALTTLNTWITKLQGA